MRKQWNFQKAKKKKIENIYKDKKINKYSNKFSKKKKNRRRKELKI